MFRVSKKRLPVVLLGLFFLLSVILLLQFGLFVLCPAERSGQDQVFVVHGGQSLKEVAGELERREIITSRTLFILWAQTMGYSKKIKAGEYRLGPQRTPIRILEKLTKGAIITHSVTIPEGFTNKQIAELLEKRGLVDKKRFLALTDDAAIATQYGISSPSLEGYLYPDTYQFGRGISASASIDTMVKRFRQVVDPLKSRAEELGMEMQKVIILASIVEKETGVPEERPMIASVFLNRLKRRMRLESDPTVIYGLKDFNGNLTRKDLLKPTPYNTYIIRHLPPGPIANPGLDSIKAVLNPAKTDYLYFVSKNDGSHYFSRTLAEHNRAVEIYQKKRKGRRGRTS
jgi:UPF0755 protein